MLSVLWLLLHCPNKNNAILHELLRYYVLIDVYLFAIQDFFSCYVNNSCYWLRGLILLRSMLENEQHHFIARRLDFSLGEIIFNSIICSHVLSLMSSTFYVILIFMKCIMGLYKYQAIQHAKNPFDVLCLQNGWPHLNTPFCYML